MLEFLYTIFIAYWGFVPVGLLFAFLGWQNRRRINWSRSLGYDLLEIIPDESQEANPGQFFEDLHSLTRTKRDIIKHGIIQEHLSFEVRKTSEQTHFYVWMPRHVRNYIEYLFGTHYPGLKLQAVRDDYSKQRLQKGVALGITVSTQQRHLYPLKQAQTDPSVLEQLQRSMSLEAGEELWVQTIVEPVPDDWKQRATRVARAARRGVRIPRGGLLDSGLGFLRSLVDSGSSKQQQELTKLEMAIKAKGTKPGFKTSIRVVYRGPQEHRAHARLQRAFTILGEANADNSFRIVETTKKGNALDEYRRRYLRATGMLLNASELAFLWHFPHKQSVEPTPEIASPQFTPEPLRLDDATAAIGRIRVPEGEQDLFTIEEMYRRYHTVIAGCEPTQNTQFLKRLIATDSMRNTPSILLNYGSPYSKNYFEAGTVRVIDPQDTSKAPVACNPLIVPNSILRSAASHILCSLLLPFTGEELRSDLQETFQATLRLLMELPEPSLLQAEMILNDTELFERSVGALHISDPDTHRYWTQTYTSMSETRREEYKASIMRAIDSILSSDYLNNCFNTSVNELNIHRIIAGSQRIQIQAYSPLGELLAGLATLQLLLFAKENTADTPVHVYIDGAGEHTHFAHSLLSKKIGEQGVAVTATTENVDELAHFIGHGAFSSIGSLFANATLSKSSRRLLSQPRLFGDRYLGPTTMHLSPEQYRLRLCLQNKIAHYTVPEIFAVEEGDTSLHPTPVITPILTHKSTPLHTAAQAQPATKKGSEPTVLIDQTPLFDIDSPPSQSVAVHRLTKDQFHSGIFTKETVLIFER